MQICKIADSVSERMQIVQIVTSLWYDPLEG